jgi:hypothetical protein
MKLVKEYLNEDMGGVSAPLSNLGNTTGMGNAQPASIAATTGAQFAGKSSTGSGDKWGNSIGPYTQGGKKVKKLKRKKKVKEVDEENINPYDVVGSSIAKKLDVPMVFSKGKGGTVKQKAFEHSIETLDQFFKLVEDVDGQPEKQNKIDVKYTDQTTKQNEKCSNCGWFKENKCGIVEGEINANGWCMLWGTKQFCGNKDETDESLSRPGLLNPNQAFSNRNMNHSIA